MSLSAAVIDAMIAAGCTAEQLGAAMKADLAEQDARKDAKRANNAERQRRFKAKRRGATDDNADNALPRVTSLDKENPPTPPKEIKPSPPIVPPKRSKSLAKPDDVSEQVWTDWTDLRRKKRATITASVVQSARDEAAQLGWTLERFLAEWIFRGSQGLKADWVAKDGKRAAANDSGGFLAHVLERNQRREQQAGGP